MAPIDSPPTMIVSQTASSFESATSTLAYHCCQVVASSSSSVPQWPASWQQCTVKPPDAMPLAVMRNSSGVPPRPCTSKKPVRLPAMVKLRSIVVIMSRRLLKENGSCAGRHDGDADGHEPSAQPLRAPDLF